MIGCTLLGYPFVPRYDARRRASLVECRLQDPSGTRSGRIGAIAALHALPIVDVVAVVRIPHRPGPLSDSWFALEAGRSITSWCTDRLTALLTATLTAVLTDGLVERFLQFGHHVVRLCAARQLTATLTATLTGTLTATLTDPGHGPVSGRARPGRGALVVREVAGWVRGRAGCGRGRGAVQGWRRAW